MIFWWIIGAAAILTILAMAICGALLIATIIAEAINNDGNDEY